MAQKNTVTAKITRKKVKTPARKAAPLLAVTAASKKPATRRANPVRRQTAKAPAKAPAKAFATTRRKVLTKAPTAATARDFGDLEMVGQEDFKACVKCGTIVAESVETLGNEVMSFTQASIEADLAAAKGILAAESLREAIDLQTDFAQARLARMTSETAKLGELSMRFASLVMEPLRSRFDANARTVFRPLGL